MNPLNAILTPVGIILLIVLGYRHYPWPMAMLWGILTIGLAHVLIRLHRIGDTVQRDGIKSVMLFVWLLVSYLCISSAFYGLGWLAAKIFH